MSNCWNACFFMIPSVVEIPTPWPSRDKQQGLRNFRCSYCSITMKASLRRPPNQPSLPATKIYRYNRQVQTFPIGFIIISFCLFYPHTPNWTLEVFVTDLPKNCLGWHLTPHFDLKIYKHKRVQMTNSIDCSLTRLNVIRTKKYVC